MAYRIVQARARRPETHQPVRWGPYREAPVIPPAFAPWLRRVRVVSALPRRGPRGV